ncbi:MAG: class I SAM-dependent methyltransferase [Alphaproteobacteria bacterium]|nr:class I SAM-dependent methyltransferase [Alphaproteobacteria bacterium]MBV9374002.1 class I SAM-dependent methyltransferase [Alphaproteobacteria bacterium]
MLRHAKPRRLIEFGSGFSLCVTLDINRLFFGGEVECTFIDPNPGRLEALIVNYHYPVNIIQSRAQDIDLKRISLLEPNDIVFIDSTHVAKAGSDVNFHLFEVLPRLAAGVLIQFHDVFYPFEYPESWFFEENRSWNENYILRAFLMGNLNYKIVFFNDLMRLRHFREVADAMPLFENNPGGALWIRKVR